MPILKIYIDEEETEFKIIPLNRMINNKIFWRYSDKEGIIDRPGYLAHVVKEPKMSKRDWENVPSSMITKIMRNIDYYVESIFYKEKELRTLHMQIGVFEDEIDDLFRYLGDDSDDWVWKRIKSLEGILENLKEKRDKIEKSLDYVKSDLVVFDKDKEVDYDVQSLQLED